MRTSIIAFTALATFTFAQDNYWSIQSPPFYLVLQSHNKTLNGQYLGACHEGAAIEGLCPVPPSTANYVTYHYNTSTQDNSSGLLAWPLTANGGALTVSSAMHLSFDPSTNVAIPILFPGNNQYTPISFTKDNVMTIPTYQDDTKPLPNYNVTQRCRWSVCTTYYGYKYETLAWTLGNGKPQNPTCQSVEVIRKFA
jgi:hypothetical protein